MKKNIIILGLIIFNFINVYSQTLEDTKDFIKEIVDNNKPMSNYDTSVMFNKNLMKFDAEKLAGKKLTNDEFENIIISGRDVYYRERNGWLWTCAETADIRDLEKVSIQKSQDKSGDEYFVVNVYLAGNFQKNFYNRTKIMEQAENKYLERMRFFIGGDITLAIKVKKAIIHLGKLKGIAVRDGDLF